MATNPVIEIHRHGRWIPAATLEPLGEERARVDYLPGYIFGEDPVPIALGLPVAFAPPRDGTEPALPPFLFDLVPQGKGRKLLSQMLGLADHDGLALPLLLAGAFNPIGALRIDRAVAFYEDHVRRNPLPPGTAGGFRFPDLADRGSTALEHLSTHAMLASGTTGVQGVAPKYLLAEDADGLLYADLALPDDRAVAHWLVKGPRAGSEDDRRVLANEAAYLRVAAACGLRVHAADHAEVEAGLLRVRRFDRVATGDGTVQRLPQESLASVAGLQGFGRPCRHNRLLEALRIHASDPLAETIEYMRRDVLNQAMRNTDNHPRNHAVQRLPDGRVQLTPLFDFAPMYLDPELVPRVVHWADAQDVRLHDWAAILPALDLPDAERGQIASALAAFAPTVARLPDTMRDAGVDARVVEDCRRTIDAQAAQLEGLR